jgi:hypothetical protein
VVSSALYAPRIRGLKIRGECGTAIILFSDAADDGRRHGQQICEHLGSEEPNLVCF